MTECGAYHPHKDLRCRLEGSHTNHLGGYPPDIEVWEDPSVIHQSDASLAELARRIPPEDVRITFPY